MINEEVYKAPDSDLATTKTSGRLLIFINYFVLVFGLALLLIFSLIAMGDPSFFQIQNVAFSLILIFSSIGAIKSLKLGWRRIWSAVGIFASGLMVIVSALFSFYSLFMKEIDAGSIDFLMALIFLAILIFSIANL